MPRATAAVALALVTTLAGAAAVLAQTDSTAPVESTTTTEPVETTTTSEVAETTTTSGVVDTTTSTIEETTTTSESTTTTATTTTTTVPAELSITPADDADLGSARARTLMGSLGEVRVTNAGSPEPRTWTVTVSATDFVNELGDVVPKANISYASGGALSGTTAQHVSPGQPTIDRAVSLSGPAVAFTGESEAHDTVVVWNPTLVLTIPDDAGEGQYDGKIVHSAF